MLKVRRNRLQKWQMVEHGTFVGKIYLCFGAFCKLKVQRRLFDLGLCRLRFRSMFCAEFGDRFAIVDLILGDLAIDGWRAEAVRRIWLFSIVAHLSFQLPIIHYYLFHLLLISRR